MGSGVTILEAVFQNRKAVGIDINPMAIFICKNTGIPVDLTLLNDAFTYLSKWVAAPHSIYHALFDVSCPICQSTASLTHIIWNNPASGLPDMVEIRIKCLKCGALQFSEKSMPLLLSNLRVEMLKQEAGALHVLSSQGLTPPQFQFEYSSSRSFLQLRHSLRKDPTSTNLFSDRNLAFLTALLHTIDTLPKKFEPVVELLKFCFTSALGQASKMVWVIDKRKGKVLKKSQVGSWTHHFFWDPTRYFEVNAWSCYQQRFKKLLAGKQESNARNTSSSGGFHLADSFQTLSKQTPVLLQNSSGTHLVIPNNSIDFIFTDPPYGDSIQYGELSALWATWLGMDMPQYLAQIEAQEIIINSHQDKSLAQYRVQLTTTFTEMIRVLKPHRFLVVTFHNTDIKVRNALLLAATDAGFLLEQILFQLPPRVSIKSMLHHAGSPIGEYYIRFSKPDPSVTSPPKKSWKREDVVQKTEVLISDILMKRGEPTSFLWISNLLDEFLFKEGLFPIENFESYLEEIKTGNLFSITPENIWWFNPPNQPEACSLPLSQRIEEYLRDYLKKNPKMAVSPSAKQDLFNLVYLKFRGKCVPDKFRTNILIEALIQ
jgi:hypothetical protein